MRRRFYGVDVGCYADFVVLRAADPIEAIRLRADRIMVVRRGKVIAEAPAQVTRLFLPGRPPDLDPVRYAPKIAVATAARREMRAIGQSQ